MTDEPGEPVSPHGDSEPMQRWVRRDSRPPDGDGTGGPGPAAGYRPVPPDHLNGRSDDRSIVTRPPRPQAGGPPVPRGHDPWSEIRHLSATGPEALPIGIWGSPASGKSTYLASLQHATGNASRSLGTWAVYARTEQSAELLSNWNAQLVGDHKFPEATDIAAATPLRWRFKGDLAGSRYQLPWRRLRRVPEPSAFDLDLIDVSGEVFGPRPADKEVPRDVVTRTLDHWRSVEDRLAGVISGAGARIS